MRPEVRVNDFICMKKSLKLSWKVYYIVTKVKGDVVECIRCSTTIPNTFIYTMNIDDVCVINRCQIWLGDYIQTQLEPFKKKIEEEIPFSILLKKNLETIKLLREDVNAITFYTKGDEKQFNSFEILEHPQPVLLPNPYKTILSERSPERKRYEWIKIHLGRNFNISSQCVRIRNLLSREDS